MRNFLYWITGFPVLLVYAFICAIFILIFTIFCALIYWSLNPVQKEYVWSAEKHLFGFINDGGYLIDSIFERIWLK